MPDNIVPDPKKEVGDVPQKVSASSEIDDVVITPDDGPVEHLQENIAEAEAKISHPSPTGADPLAWQGTSPSKTQAVLSPAGDNLSALRERITHAQEVQEAAHAAASATPILKPAAVPPTQPGPGPEEQENEQEKNKQASPLPTATTPTALRSLRTFKSDIDQVVTHRQVSVIGAMAAEQNKQTREGTFSAPAGSGFFSPLTYIILGVSITLFVIGGAAVGIAFYFSKPPGSVLQTDQIPAYITVEDQQAVKTDGLARSYLMSILIKGQQALNTKVGSITQVYFTKDAPDAATGNPVATLLPASEFFSVFELHAPDPLVRALVPKMMFGFYQFDQARPFIILKTTAYEIAFAGMLSWERDLNADLAPLFGPVLAQKLPRQLPKEKEEIVATSSTATTSSSTLTSNISGSSSSSTATSTTPIVPTTPETPDVFVPHAFEDAVVKNKDVRILRDAAGKVALMYGFYDKETIIITNDENTFKEVVARLASRRF